MTIRPLHIAGAGVTAIRSMRVAVIDEDSGFVQVLGKQLDRVGAACHVLPASTAAERLAVMPVNAVVVDPATSGLDRWTSLERLCAQLSHFGVVVCTGPSAVAERVRGLRLGADDWVTKPCHPEEVVARIEASIRSRRSRDALASTVPLAAGELEISRDHYQVYAGAACAQLTRREFELIELLAGAEGRLIEREAIYARVWGYSMAHGDRSVDVYVRKLRRKLGQISPGWRYIHTHFGIGYRFAAESVDPGTVEEQGPRRNVA
jgi:DNA-binding response OmpR family regulator